ncbi:MAG: hypothetical protein AAFX46_17760, partial [Cyanobacteria bacterium J06636_27]
KVVEDLARETDDKYQKILQMFSQMSKKQESQAVGNSASEILKPPVSIDNQKIIDDFFQN